MSERTRFPAKVIVIGAGIAGLSCARKIIETAKTSGEKIEVTLLEASQKGGGKITTDRSHGILTESGPDSFLAIKPEAVSLSKELGLELIAANPNAARVWVRFQNRLHSLPKGTGLIPSKIFPFLFSNLLTFKGRLRVLAEPWIPLKSGVEDESIASFVSRRFGREFLEKIADPILSGIYAAPSESISLLSTFPSFREMENRGGVFRSLSKTKSNHATFMTLKDGLSSLSNALIKEIPSQSFKRESPVLDLSEERDGWTVKTPKENFWANAVIAAIPANALAPLCLDRIPELSSVLSEIPFTNSAVVNLIYDRASVSHPLNGYGFVSCRKSNSPFFAATFSSTKFPHRSGPEKALIRVFIGNMADQDLSSKDEAALAQIAHEEIAPLLGLTAQPLEIRVSKWMKAHPVYSVGHGLRIKRIASCLKDHPGLFVAGSSYHGIGLPDCIRSGHLAAEQALSLLKSGPSKKNPFLPAENSRSVETL